MASFGMGVAVRASRTVGSILYVQMNYESICGLKGPNLKANYGLRPPENCQPLWEDAMSHDDPWGSIREEVLDARMEEYFLSRESTPIHKKILSGEIKIVHTEQR